MALRPAGPTAAETAMTAALEHYLNGLQRFLILKGLNHPSPVPEGATSMRKLFRKGRSALVLASLILGTTHLLTPGAGWADRGLTAARTLLADAAGGCGWLLEKKGTFTIYWWPQPSAEADLLAESIRSDERWVGCGSDGVKLVSAIDKAPLFVTVYSGFTDVGFFNEQEGKFADAWKLLGADCEHVAKAVRQRQATLKAAETRRTVAEVSAHLAPTPMPTTEPRPALQIRLTDAEVRALVDRVKARP